MRNVPLKGFLKKSPLKDRRTKTLYDEYNKPFIKDVPHDHNNSGKKYGKTGHTGKYSKGNDGGKKRGNL